VKLPTLKSFKRLHTYNVHVRDANPQIYGTQRKGKIYIKFMLTQNMGAKILGRVRSLKKQMPQGPFFAYSTFKKKRHLLDVSRGGRYKFCIKWQSMHKTYSIR